MPYQRYELVRYKMGLRCAALAANIDETPYLAEPLARLEGMQALLSELVTEQARLTAARQEVSKRISEVVDEAQKVMTFVDSGIKSHYGNRSEKLTAYGMQPYRSKPRVQKVGPDGKPVKKAKTADDAEATASPEA